GGGSAVASGDLAGARRLAFVAERTIRWAGASAALVIRQVANRRRVGAVCVHLAAALALAIVAELADGAVLIGLAHLATDRRSAVAHRRQHAASGDADLVGGAALARAAAAGVGDAGVLRARVGAGVAAVAAGRVADAGGDVANLAEVAIGAGSAAVGVGVVTACVGRGGGFIAAALARIR